MWQPFYLTPSIKVSDIICGDDITFACVMNFMVDVSWLVGEIPALSNIPFLLLHGQSNGLGPISLSNIVHSQVDLGAETYGTHHTKLMIIFYQSGVRVCVGTANLISSDFEMKRQGIFVQDFPWKENLSKTCEFEDDLLSYLRCVTPTSRKATDSLRDNVILALRRCDFASAEVDIVASVPGRHSVANEMLGFPWGHLRLRSLLSKEQFSCSCSCSSSLSSMATVSMQCSSLGSMGKDEKFLDELVCSMRPSAGAGENKKQPPAMQIIWPSVEFVRYSLEGYAAGSSIPCDAKNIRTTDGMYKNGLASRLKIWEPQGRNALEKRAAPHIKSYCSYRRCISSTAKTEETNPSRTPTTTMMRDRLVGVKRLREAPASILLSSSSSSSSFPPVSAQVIDLTCSDDESVLHRTQSSASPTAVDRFDLSREDDNEGENDVELDWFLLSSSNLSQAAWGILQKKDSVLYIKSFEMGVLFRPSRVRTNHRMFSCTPDHPLLGMEHTEKCKEAFRPGYDADKPTTNPPSVFRVASSTQRSRTLGRDVIQFPLPYKLNSRPYDFDRDEPWIWNISHHAPDCYNRRHIV